MLLTHCRFTAQVETLLKTQEPPNSGTPVNAMPRMPSTNTSDTPSIALPCQPLEDVTQLMPNTGGIDPTVDSMMGSLGLETLSWELIGLGLEEPLPSQEVIDDMYIQASVRVKVCVTDFYRHRIYFEKIHPSMPIIHRPRYLAAMNLAPSMRPPVCLRYAMWTWVCSITPKYSALTEHFYARARKYAEKDEMKGFGESMVTVAHCQCWCLISNYEFKTMYFPRAWQSVGRATRLGQILGLQTQGNVGPDVKQVLPPPRDWIEREERRRTFWLTFCQDRYASMGTGWPMTIDEKDVCCSSRSSSALEQVLTKFRLQRPFLRLMKLTLMALQR